MSQISGRLLNHLFVIPVFYSFFSFFSELLLEFSANIWNNHVKRGFSLQLFLYIERSFATFLQKLQEDSYRIGYVCCPCVNAFWYMKAVERLPDPCINRICAFFWIGICQPCAGTSTPRIPFPNMSKPHFKPIENLKTLNYKSVFSVRRRRRGRNRPRQGVRSMVELS